MQVSYASLSVAGPVRPHNEDCVGYWAPQEEAGWRDFGAVVVLADGVGGQDCGEVASRLACDAAVRTFNEARPATATGQLLRQMFTAANIAVYDENLRKNGSAGRMATTLTISVFRHNQVDIGHVGDCRVYLIQQNRIRRLTNDHSYAGVQLKLGLITVQDALSSELRSVLTRTVGQDPTVRVDYHTVTVNTGDVIVQMCDGVWSQLTEGEIQDAACKLSPDEACREIIRTAERRGADDNLSVQVIHIDSVERLSYYRGLPTYQKENPAVMGTELEVGQTLDDRYRITDLISRSGMASIFKAIDSKTGQTVALKVPFMQFESDPGFYSRFQREQEIGQTLSHPYILKVWPEEEGEQRSRPYLAMEYLDGQTLGHLMCSVRPMPAADALKLAGRISEALHYLHDHGVVHRDLKPDNVMILNDGTIRIMDFGIAKTEGRRLTFGGFTPAMGTPDYMAPEQVKGRRGDARTDVYSLGAILYEMLTGSVPFEGANPLVIMNARLTGDPVAPRERNPDLSPQVEEIVLHAMARNPADRYASALAMKDDLDHPDQVQVTGRADRLVAPTVWKGRWVRMRWKLAALAVPVIVFLAFYLARHMKFSWN
jgi:serine/threonine protein phosphatase PrpC